MSTVEDFITKLHQIKTVDPKIKISNSYACIKPFYFNYPLIANVIGIVISIYCLVMQNDPFLNLVLYYLQFLLSHH